MRILLLIIMMIFSASGTGFQNENLFVKIPKNFKLDFKDYNKQTNISLLEFVPKNESVKNWSKMITITSYTKNINLTASEYIQRMKEMWKKHCKKSYTKILPNGMQNGYKYAFIKMYCSKTKITNKEELVFMKAIKGKTRFYVVQKAFSYKPNKKTIEETMKYFQKVTVFDTKKGNGPKILR